MRLGQWWDTVSHNQLWAGAIAGVIATLVSTGILTLTGTIFNASPHHAAQVRPIALLRPVGRAAPLRVEFLQEARGLFDIAFYRDIGIPTPSEEWRALHDHGGIDVGISQFKLTLTNPFQSPATVTNIEAEVLTSEAPPTAWHGAVYSQGSEPIESFVVNFASDTPGNRTPLHKTENYNPIGRPFFATHDISLRPGEVYQAVVLVYVDTTRALRYRFVISGNTARSGFSIDTPGFFEIAPSNTIYTHNYWSLGQCWIKVYTLGPQESPTCTH